ncbi:hypothetical protein SCAB_58712 [Streptomyces scabiei 87.22]|uniref:Uncharacterized protein n=1 Tax=Streptomyces scabiei (strain 87.22) TaxID=680198 RepID=C9Z5R0_STRSW|nr:hypothetical protein SCAB_58712 [Streptomyces scabiei 87.22]
MTGAREVTAEALEVTGRENPASRDESGGVRRS